MKQNKPKLKLRERVRISKNDILQPHFSGKNNRKIINLRKLTEGT